MRTAFANVDMDEDPIFGHLSRIARGRAAVCVCVCLRVGEGEGKVEGEESSRSVVRVIRGMSVNSHATRCVC